MGLIPSIVWIIGVVLVLGFFVFGWDWIGVVCTSEQNLEEQLREATT